MKKIKKNIKIGMRACTDSRPKYFPVIVGIWAAIFFTGMCLTSMLPRLTRAAETTASEDTVMQLTFTGDTAIARYTKQLAEKNGYDSLFEGVKDTWADSDFVFTNLEYTVLTDDEYEYEPVENKKVVLGGTTESLEALRKAGINVFGVANNHSSDFGTKGFDDEITYMYKYGYKFAGYYLGVEEEPEYSGPLTALYNRFQDEPYKKLTCADGTTIGFIAVADQSTSETHLSSRVMKTSASDLYSFVNASEKDNDLTVVYLHCGTENTFVPEDTQKEYAHALINAGADIVCEMHAHVLLPVEEYNGGIIFYGLGNFIFDQEMTSQRNSVIVQYNRQSDGSGYFELIPLRINNGYTQVTSSRFYISQINAIMTQYLNDDDYYINDTGHMVIPWQKGGT